MSSCALWDGTGLVGWEECVMWLGPCEIAADFCPRRLLHGDCGILLAGERLTGLSPGRLLGVSAQEERYAVLLRGLSCGTPQ